MPTQSSVTVQVIAIVVDRQLVGFSFESEFCTADPVRIRRNDCTVKFTVFQILLQPVITERNVCKITVMIRRPDADDQRTEAADRHLHTMTVFQCIQIHLSAVYFPK